MKSTRLMVFGLMILAAVCRAQITDPGWYQATVSGSFGEPLDTNQAEFSAQWDASPDATGVPSSPIAEAITPQIQALADGLLDDPERIYNYVHNHIKFVLYFGSKKGAQLTLLEKSGNDFDQCALLMAMLRAAGYTNAQYQFGWQAIPYTDPNNQDYDLIHWWKLGLPNTNWNNTLTYVEDLMSIRGYPWLYYAGDNNSFIFQRVWVSLSTASTNYTFDPAFKVYEPNYPVLSLPTAMGSTSAGISNALLSAAAGTDTGNYVTNLNETSVRNALTGYTTNLLNYIQSNAPNESVEDVLGESLNNVDDFYQDYGWPTYNPNGYMPVVSWTYEPTNLMSTFQVRFAGTNWQCYIPQLQGKRLALTFDGSGTAQLWQDDSLLVQHSTSGTSSITNVALVVTHPVGSWNFTNNTFIPNATNWANMNVTNTYQRTNATYALLYAFEPDWAWLQQRQNVLDGYITQGMTNGSRQVLSETLNVMGLNWMIQSTKAEEMLAVQFGMLPQYFHRLGRMGQETGRGYYVDVYMALSGVYPDDGDGASQMKIMSSHFDLSAIFSSALENGIIEQLQNSNIVGASTVKMLEIANTNGQAVYLASSTNWTTGLNVKSKLVNYDTTTLNAITTSYINTGCSVLLPQNGSNHVSSATGSWAGFAYEALRFTNTPVAGMIIGGGYHGGYSSIDTFPNTPYVVTFSDGQPQYFLGPPPYTLNFTTGDPVDTADATYQVENTDLSLGQAEPRGIALSRYYNGTRRNSNPTGMAPGWIHNYCITANMVPAPEAGLGGSTPAQAAPLMVATAAAISMYNAATPDAKNWLTTALIAKWGIDQLTKNGVSIALGKDTVQFVQQPNGVFTPPANNTMTLVKNGSSYSLQQRHGNTFNFNSVGLLTNIVDQYGNALSLTYNSSNWVSSVKDWKNRTLTFNYTGTPSRLTSVSDGTRTVSYGYSTAYNAQGDLTSYTDPESKTSTYQYDTNHQITATLDAASRLVVSNIYNSQGRLTTQYTQGDTNRTWRYYWTDWKTTEFDPANGETDYLYDDQKRLVLIDDPLGNLTTYYYDGQNHVIDTVSPENEVHAYYYDSNNNLIQTIDPLTFTNQLFYDDQNNLIKTVDERGNATKFGYNSQFSLTGKTNAAGDFVNYSYNADGTLYTRTDAGGATSYGYDSYGQLNSVTYPSGLGSESFVNDTLGNVTSHTGARGFTTTFQYNQRRQLTNTIAPSNVVSRIAYDAVGNTASLTDARGFSTTNTWSATGHLLATTLPATPQGVAVVSNVYDSRDWLAETLDPYRQPTLYTNDADGHLVYTTDPLSRISAIGYDRDARIIATTNAAFEVTTNVWDPRSYLRIVADPAKRTYERVIDGSGNQTALTNRNGHAWQFQFDAANRLTNTISPSSHTASQSWNHQGLVSAATDPNGSTTTFSYDARGRLTNRVDGVGSTLYGLDASGNMTNMIENGQTNSWTFDAYNRVSSYTDAGGNLIQYRYDANNNLTNLIYPGGRAVFYSYNSLNRLTNVTDWANRQTMLTYDLAGRLTSITRPNGTVSIINYDAAGEATNIIEKTTWNYPIAFFTCSLNAAARVQWEFAAPTPHSNSVPTRTMTYNADNSLATVDGHTVINDYNGNLLFGPLTNDTLVNYSFDTRNRLINVHSVTYYYDAANNRIGLQNGTSSESYVVDPNSKLSRILMRVKNGTTNYYVYGPGLLYEVTETATSTNTATYHYDYRGSTVALTDGNGLPTDRIEYSAYGTITYRSGTTDTPFLFNGCYGVMTDPNGLLYMRARYYNPFLCRFINPDPSGFAGGLNFYAFANGNPVSLIDPFGLDAQQGWGGATASWIQNNISTPLIKFENTDFGQNFPVVGPVADFLEYNASGLADLLRLGQGTANATYNAQDGYDVAIGITQDVQRAAGITLIVGGGLQAGTGDTPPADTTPASTPVGRSGQPLTVQPGLNSPTTINGLDYTGHALDSMQSDGIPPSVVQNTISQGASMPGKVSGTTAYYDPVNNVTVITDSASGRVVTVSRGQIKQ